MSGKETARVAVGSAAEKDEVEDGHADGVARGEGVDELCLVVVGEGLEEVLVLVLVLVLVFSLALFLFLFG